MSVNTSYNTTEPYIREFQSDMSDMKKINESAVEEAIEAHNLLRTTIIEFDNTTSAMREKFNAKLASRDKTIKILAVSLVIISGCAIALGIKILTKSCPTG